MNRRGFFKLLLGGSIASSVAPAVLSALYRPAMVGSSVPVFLSPLVIRASSDADFSSNMIGCLTNARTSCFRFDSTV